MCHPSRASFAQKGFKRLSLLYEWPTTNPLTRDNRQIMNKRFCSVTPLLALILLTSSACAVLPNHPRKILITYRSIQGPSDVYRFVTVDNPAETAAVTKQINFLRPRKDGFSCAIGGGEAHLVFVYQNGSTITTTLLTTADCSVVVFEGRSLSLADPGSKTWSMVETIVKRMVDAGLSGQEFFVQTSRHR